MSKCVSPDLASMKDDKKHSPLEVIKKHSNFKKADSSMESIDELEERNLNTSSKKGFIESPTFPRNFSNSEEKPEQQNSSQGNLSEDDLETLNQINDSDETGSVSNTKSVLSDFQEKSKEDLSEQSEDNQSFQNSDDLDRASSSSNSGFIEDSDDLDRLSLSELKNNKEENKVKISFEQNEEEKYSEKVLETHQYPLCSTEDFLKPPADHLVEKRKAPGLRNMGAEIIKIEPLDAHHQDHSDQEQVEKRKIEQPKEQHQFPHQKTKKDGQLLDPQRVRDNSDFNFEDLAKKATKALSSQNLRLNLKNIDKGIDVHKIKVYDQMVILFGTLLLKLNRLKDSFTVLNTYGRR